ncbi:MAG: hypothetical protein ACTSRD_12840, partial [Promethearchaeota archaeon]
ESILKNITRNNGFNILINHFGIAGQMKGIPGQSKYMLDKKVKPYIDYLGTGHFHKQYLLDDYIYNPGCLSPACLSDFNLPHGYFLVNVIKENKFSIQITKKRVHERRIIWKVLSIKSKPNSKQNLFSIVENFLKKEIPIRRSEGEIFSPENLPVLCLTIRSSSGKLFSTAAKKELRISILQSFQVVECHVFQNQINYKPIERFFPVTSCVAQD